MKLVYAFRLCRSKSGKVIKLLIKRVLDATIFEGLDILLNPNFMREAGIYVHNLPQKVEHKQCIEYNRINIPLTYLLCRSKMLLELINNIAEIVHKKILIGHRNLSEILEELPQLDCVAGTNLQLLLY